MNFGMHRGTKIGRGGPRSARAFGWGRFARMVLVGLVVAGPALADLRRVEAVGTYGIKPSARGRVVARDEAVRDARREAVTRVALERLGASGRLGDEFGDADEREAPPLERSGAPVDPNDVRFGRVSPSEDEAALLASALGEDMLPYTRSYRLVEDQGERPVLFEDAPGIRTEYVVVVQVVVDAARVDRALVQAGLVAAASSGRQEALVVEFLGIRQFAAFDRVLAALSGRLGATKVTALEFSPSRQVVAVSGPFDGEGLADRLTRLQDSEIRLEPVDFDRGSGRLRVLAEAAPTRFEGSDAALDAD